MSSTDRAARTRHPAQVGAKGLAAPVVLAALLAQVTLATTADAQELYFATNPSDRGDIVVTGISDGTAYAIVDLESTEEIAAGTVDRFETVEVDGDEVHRFVVEASHPVLAYLGYDCCGVGGTTYLPTEDGHARIGRAFAAYFPILGTQADLLIFAVEDALVVLADPDGVPFARRNIDAGMSWNAYPVVGARPFIIRSTGDIAVMLNAVNGLASVPPADRAESCDNDVGREFYFATHSWGSGAMAVFAYEDADITVQQLGADEPTATETIAADGWFYMRELGRRSYRLVSTGDVAVWTGDLEGGEAIGDMGDDFSFNLGRGGRSILFHGQNHGATVIAPYADTTITLNGEEHLLDARGWVDVESGVEARVDADRPVVAITFGGNDLNDWGGFLRPAPHDPAAGEACPELDAGIPEWPDGGTDADVGPGDADLDAGPGDADLDEAPADGSPDADADEPTPEPRSTCDCRAAAPAASRLSALAAMLGGLLH